MNRILVSQSAVNWPTKGEVLREFFEEMEQALQAYAEAWFARKLEAELERWLRRRPYERRDRKSGRQVQARCCKCGSRYPRDFTRHGHRERRLLTTCGQITVWAPRVVCECGGSVQVPFEVLSPRQRIWDDVTVQIHQWGKMALSLRQMQAALAEALHTSVGLRTLNERLQMLRERLPGSGVLRSVPPVVVLDAIQVTLLADTGEHRIDKGGRQRSVKHKTKEVILVALGIWPHTGTCKVLDWELGERESAEDWGRLLARLSKRQLWRERGLCLFIHDGDSGLKAALTAWYWDVPSQRCVFHKLRNAWQAIAVPDDLSPAQQRQLKQRLIRQAAAVFKAVDERQARYLLAVFKEQWQDSQPEAVAVLHRDLEDTLRFYAFLRRNPDWRAESLRTTSALERINRKLRRPFRTAGAYHSPQGLLSSVARVLSPLLIS